MKMKKPMTTTEINTMFPDGDAESETLSLRCPYCAQRIWFLDFPGERDGIPERYPCPYCLRELKKGRQKIMNKHELMYERIRHHGERLQVIFPKMADLDPVALCKKLRRIELKTERAAVAYCNGDIDTDEWERVTEKTLADLDKLLNFYALNIPVFVNGDPRGYALKIDDEYVREHNLNIHRDWGGYGIIAPDLREGE